MNNTLITRREDGEYSTTRIGDYIETMWFGDDGDQMFVSSTFLNLAAVAEKHIHAFESEGNN